MPSYESGCSEQIQLSIVGLSPVPNACVNLRYLSIAAVDLVLPLHLYKTQCCYFEKNVNGIFNAGQQSLMFMSVLYLLNTSIDVQ